MNRERPAPRLLLHAGMPKTGTASIQQALSQRSWKNTLLSKDIHYLNADSLSPNHSRYFHALRGKPEWRGAAEHRRLASQFETAVRDHCARLPPDSTLLISAESIFAIALWPGQLGPISDWLRRFLTDIAVVLYVREPLSFANSRMQQSLKTGHPPGAAVITNAIRESAADAAIANLETQFGKGNVLVRYFDPALLDGGDAVRDFCTRVLGIRADPRLEARLSAKQDCNHALTAEMLEPLLAFYRERAIAPPSLNRQFVRELAAHRWEGTKSVAPLLDETAREKLATATDAVRERIRARAGFDCFPSFRPPETGSASPELRLQTDLANLRQLRRLVRQAEGRPGIGADAEPSSEPDTPGAIRAGISRLLARLYDLQARGKAAPLAPFDRETT